MTYYDLSEEDVANFYDEGIHLVGWLLPNVLRRTKETTHV
jgi:hypothetical protein